MPGILPMKVIKVGTSSQSRIAQACDRCRSKKIRCDGIRPTCSQCANVGFECRTSDKLSRRAFPRGYTESLEERVRQLEAEVRDLKDLLDEKDEKIDMLSKMHGNRRPPAGAAATPPPETRREATPAKDDTFRIQASPLLLGVENSDSYFMGGSSGRSFIEAFKRKIQENGKSCSDFNTEAFLHIQGCYPLVANSPVQTLRAPPRLFSDRCVNVYFQEWAPLFPVLHRPTFLRIYEEFVTDPDKVKSNHKLAQLYLVFSIAALSSDKPDLDQIAVCEQQWKQALEAVLMDNTMNTLQCLVLALLYCTVRADYKRLQHYKGIAVGLSHRLGLHQSQKRFSFGALTIETRKKVFWTLYTLDCFSAAILGLPKLLKEEDIHAEYPSDTDDEYVTEKGFQPTLPGEYTRLSSALALFRGARILGKVLEKIYPAATSHELSLQQMAAIEAELDSWSENLPQHLKLTFKQDKPSTDITGSRSPLLALAFYYIRTLIYRPAVGSSLGAKAASALLSIGESSKHIIQIVELLEERNMSFSFCLNKTDLLILCGMTLLYQTIDLKKESKVMKDNERLANTVIKIVDRFKAPGTYDFKRVAGMLITLDEPIQQPSLPTPPRQSPDRGMAAPPLHRASPSASQHPVAPAVQPKKKAQYPLSRHMSISESELLFLQQEKLRRMTMPNTQLPGTNDGRSDLQRPGSRSSFDNIKSDPAALLQQRRRDNHHLRVSQATMLARASPKPGVAQNLDYLPLGNTPSHSQPASPTNTRLPQQQQQQQNAASAGQRVYSSASPAQQQISQKVAAAGISPAAWEALLGQMEGGQLNVYDAIYGGPSLAMSEGTHNTATSSFGGGGGGGGGSSGWSPDSLDLSGFNLGDFGTDPAPPQSVLSFSDESLSSGEDISPSDLGLGVGGLSSDYRTGYHLLDGLEGFSRI